jgi:hypothetical protein
MPSSSAFLPFKNHEYRIPIFLCLSIKIALFPSKKHPLPGDKRGIDGGCAGHARGLWEFPEGVNPYFGLPITRTYVLIPRMKKPRKTEEQKDFEKGIFLVPCPRCGYKQIYAWYEVNDLFICHCCGVNSWLRYKYLDQRLQIVYWLQLVPDP